MPNEEIVVSDDEIIFRCCAYRNEAKKEKCKTVLKYPRKKAMERVEKIKQDRVPFLLGCPKCHEINCITGQICEDPGFELKDGRKIVAKDWLGCMAFTGPTSSDPTGYITDGSNKLYVDIKGNRLTRDQFKEEYHCDPAQLIKDLWEQNRIAELIDSDCKKCG